jgi:pyruvate/2-oxoglutarate dehydrogenase complex dihydrolipoamide acyltransferase (E2) component
MAFSKMVVPLMNAWIDQDYARESHDMEHVLINIIYKMKDNLPAPTINNKQVKSTDVLLVRMN